MIVVVALAVSVKSNKLSGGFEVFSKQGVVGVEVSAMGKTVTLNNNYKPGMISTTLLANGTPLPGMSSAFLISLKKHICILKF